MRQLYKILTLILFLACFVSASAQVRTVTFTGRDRTNQYHIPLSKVMVFNLDQLWEEVLYYPDTTLILGTVGVDDYNLTSSIQLMQNVPNPFDGITEFALVLPEDRDVLLEIYDISGRLAVGQHFADLSAGTHLFQATLTSPQIYLLSAKMDDGQMTIKMINEGHGAGNTIRHLGMTDANGDFTLYLKNDKYSSGYPFNVGDEMKYTGYAVIEGVEQESTTIVCSQINDETIPLLFGLTAPTVMTDSVMFITHNMATCGGDVTATGGAAVTARGICWSTLQNPTINDSHIPCGSGTGSFTCSITDLTAGTMYYVRAYATNSVGTAYGEQRSFTTLTLPTVTTNMVTDITSTTANCGGDVIYDGGANVTARGVCWSTSQYPTIGDSHTTNGIGAGIFTSNITGLSSGTTYYVRAYATNSVGTAYGEQRILTTLTLPIVLTGTVTDITSSTATSGGNVISDGGAMVTARGVCWSTSQNPTLNDTHTLDGNGVGVYTSTFVGLNAGTTYYLRAYATNSVGTAYGEQRIFTTHSLPTVTTNMVTGITSTTATSGGNVTSDGGATVTALGVCWSTSQNPTVNDSHTFNGSGTGSFTSNMIGLSAGTIYYVRAYATNSVGTAYGEQRIFTTLSLPTVTTNTVTDITSTTATCGGNVTSAGGATVTARGVCWSISQNPTVSDSHTTNGSGAGSFTSSLTGLTPNTTYYVRAYATNSVGTGYGEQKPFTTSCNSFTISISGNTAINYGQSTTLTASGASSYHWSTNATTASITVSPTSTTTYTVTGTNSYGCTATASKTVTVNPIVPTVTTNNVTNISTNSATCGGNVTSNGGANVSARGVCWGTSQNPTVSNSHTTNGSGTGSFTSSLTGLTPNTTYYVRAYATNSAGTGYGAQKTFTTQSIIDEKSCPAAPTVIDHEGNVYATVQIGNQCWMRDNLRTTTSPSTGTYLIPNTSVNYTYTGKQACWYNNDSVTYAPMNYGLLYNWNAAVDTFNTAYGETSVNTDYNNAVSVTFNGHCRGICPPGWHLPSDAEWIQLTDYVCSQSEYVCGDTNINIAKALASEMGWNTSTYNCAVGNNQSANNATGLSAVPAGYCYGSSFGGVGNYAYFWSATRGSSHGAYSHRLYYINVGVNRGNDYKYSGFSVRCLRDAGTAVIDSKSCPAAPTVTDHDGNVYATVQIGNQCWMRDNLRTTTSPSTGTYLVNNQFTSSTSIAYTYTGKMARWYNNDSVTYAPMNYGLLYNWNAAVDTFNTAYGETSVNTDYNNAVSVTVTGHRKGICPAGWHLPSNAEWNTMTNYVSGQGEYVCGDTNMNIAKALADSVGWYSSTTTCAIGNNPSTNNATGFGALPAGCCANGFVNDAHSATFWSITQSSSSIAYYRGLHNSYAGDDCSNGYKSWGRSVRCLRDETGTAVVDEKSCPAAPTVIDHEGNVYATVQIGNQCWMRDNLRTTTSPSTGTYLIPAANANYTYTGKQARWYDNDSATYAPMNYGLLYNWNAAVDTFNTAYGETSVNTSSSNAVSVTFNGHRRGICPAGWHLPSDAEWTQLTDYVSSQSEYTCGGNSSNIAKALASAEGWYTSTNNCAVGNDPSSNNATGFSAVPAGVCNGSSFDYAGFNAYFWSSTQNTSGYAYGRYLYYYNANVNRNGSSKNGGYSVRCLRDETGTAVVDEKSCPAAPTVTDHEGNVYATVQIGNQCWMRDNLRTTTSPSTGTYLIPAAGTGYTYTGKQARWYNNDSATYASMNYGLLYNWNAAVDTFNMAYGETSVNTDYNNAVSVAFSAHRRGICPAGWHLPSVAEWTQLTDYVSSQIEYTCGGNNSYIAKALASAEGWNTHTNNCAVGNDPSLNNATGFSAVPAGYCPGSSFHDVGGYAYFWSSTQIHSDDAFYRDLFFNLANVNGLGYPKLNGFSVRCLRD